MRAAAEAAARAGVTRLANVTGLDRIGLPVWQSVRPMSRALSVHQGKAFDHDSARIGALMEAVESCHAESWTRIDCSGGWDDLPADARPAAQDDYAWYRGKRCDAMAWCQVEPLGEGPAFHVPFACVSLDLTWPGPPKTMRSSDGQAAHFSLAAALAGALRELIERDARAERDAEPLTSRMSRLVDLRTIAYPWFAPLADRLRRLGIAIRLSALSAAVPMPAFYCELVDRSPFARAHAVCAGAGCHVDAEKALIAALLEAAQTRVTIIAGARDDLHLEPGSTTGAEVPRATLPLPPSHAGLPFPQDAAIAGDDEQIVGWIVTQLARSGFGQAGYIRLSPEDSAVMTVKAFVPGLGSGDRRRRCAA